MFLRQIRRKKSLFSLIGPPRAIPNWLRVNRPFGYVIRIVVIGIGRKGRNPVEFVHGTMKVVGPSLGSNVHDSTGRAPVLSGEIAIHKAELLHGIEWHLLT